MTHRALVIPADPAQPLDTIEWGHGRELLGLLYGWIGCETVDSFRFQAPGVVLTGWVDDSGWYAPQPLRNARLHALVADLGQPRLYPVMGTVVLTGDVDWAGNSVGLPDGLLPDLLRVLGQPAPS